MNFNLDFKVNLWTVLVLAVCAFLLINRSELKQDVTRWRNNYDNLNSEHTEFLSEHDSMIIHMDGIISLTNKELKNALKSDSIQRELVKEYKKAAASIKVETKFVTDTIYIPVPIEIDSDTSVAFSNECLSLDLSVRSGGLSLDNITIENRQDILLGDRKTGLWKTEQSFMIRNTNPCFTTQNATVYTVSVDRKWHEKWWLTIPVSFGVGYLGGTLTK